VDHLNQKPILAGLLTQQAVLERDPFVLIDVGASGGIHPVWRKFGSHLVAFGFDPQKSECRRLQENEPNPRVTYVPRFVGLPESHPFVQRRHAENSLIVEHFDPWKRLSCDYAIVHNLAQLQAQPVHEDLADAKDIIGVSDFVKSSELSNVDFIKIDVDGTDLDVLISSEEIVRSHSVLGFAIEVNWTGSHLDTANTFHNIDRKMREFGYSLADISYRRYSRMALPLPFIHNFAGDTEGGQVIQGDAVYLRDAASQYDRFIWNSNLSPIKLLKLAALYDIFSLPDMAAEIIAVKREQIASTTDPNALLDALTPFLHGRKMSYGQYIHKFETEVGAFFPFRKSGVTTVTSTISACANAELGGADLQETLDRWVDADLIDIDSLVVHHALQVSQDNGLFVRSPSEQWSYAISFPVHTNTNSPGAAKFEFEVKILEGAIGFGAILNDNKTFIQEVICRSQEDWQRVRIFVDEVSDCAAIVVRNVAAGDTTSKLLIRSVRGAVKG
jgi:FkbM family methyltransferase